MRFWLPAARDGSGPRRVLAALSLLLLFVAGPLHVWHHADESLLGSDGECLPCSTFHKTFWIESWQAENCWELRFAGYCSLAPDTQPIGVDRPATHGRAPPELV